MYGNICDNAVAKTGESVNNLFVGVDVNNLVSLGSKDALMW